MQCGAKPFLSGRGTGAGIHEIIEGYESDDSGTLTCSLSLVRVAQAASGLNIPFWGNELESLQKNHKSINYFTNMLILV